MSVVLERLALHHVAPVAGRVADRQEDRADRAALRGRGRPAPMGTSPPGCSRAGAGTGWSPGRVGSACGHGIAGRRRRRSSRCPLCRSPSGASGAPTGRFDVLFGGAGGGKTFDVIPRHHLVRAEVARAARAMPLDACAPISRHRPITRTASARSASGAPVLWSETLFGWAGSAGARSAGAGLAGWRESSRLMTRSDINQHNPSPQPRNRTSSRPVRR